MSPGLSPRIQRRSRILNLACFALLVASACNRDSGTQVGAGEDFREAGKEAELAMAKPVTFRLTESIFNRWERAQANLDRLPSGAIQRSAGGDSGDPIERAVSRLQNSRQARKAVESAGLSVRDFVLATVALAQAVEAADGGPRSALAGVPPQNVSFVLAHRSRLATRTRTPQWATEGEIADAEADAMSAGDSEAVAESDVPAEPPVVIERDDTPPPPPDSVSDSLTVFTARQDG